jgi:hypothetical protein
VEQMRILALWDYARPNWVAPLEGLVARGHEVVYLAYRSQEREPARPGIPDERERHFWNEFRSAQQLLRRIKPDRVVLMGTEGAWAISTIAAARRRQIPTAVLQHGVYAPLDRYLKNEYLVRELASPPLRDRFPAVAFLVRSLLHRPSELLRAIGFLVRSSRTTPRQAAAKHSFSSRLADGYLIAAHASSALLRDTNRIDEDRFIEVGLAEFDEIVLARLPDPEPRHALIIDSPHTGGKHADASMSGEHKRKQFERIAADLARHGWRLTVKLHPASYSDTWPVDGPDIHYVRQADLKTLIASSTAVLGFSSTLLIPALLHRPGVLLTVESASTWLAFTAQSFGAVPPAVSFENVRAADIIDAVNLRYSTDSARRSLAMALIGPLDGQSATRIERALFELRLHATR